MLSKRREVVPPKSLEIKQDDKFFSRIMSKETSMANSSRRVYYGGTSGAIPFMWESSPGTPKHTFADTSIPPLTPPPSYHSTSKSKSMHKKSTKQNLFSTIFPKLTSQNGRKTRVSPSSSMSSTTTSTSSSSLPSFYSSSSTFKNSKSSFYFFLYGVNN
ncbi:hypothetical protein P3X46_014473 [Hevea brasiliensis]|uniref:DUF4005 domain-containing protein n=1 Tax=Hevea brasiliensis TaxID=3981 RepID=A0ABQ9M8K9_HEVBR|nr:hypothetical protein P3X46_014473 [Hevea brasiliensis]